MHQQAGALNVAQKLCPQPCSGVSALDQSANIRNNDTLYVRLFSDSDNPEIRLQRSERIISDLRTRGRNVGNQSGLSYVRESDERHVSQQLQLQPVSSLLSRAPGLALSWRLVCRGRKLGIASSTASAPSNDDGFVRSREVVDSFSGFVVVEDGADRHLQYNVFTFTAGFIRTFTMPAALRLVFRIEAEMHERIMTFARFHNYIAALAAVSARRTAARNKFLAPESDATITPVPSLNTDYRFIDEHGYACA